MEELGCGKVLTVDLHYLECVDARQLQIGKQPLRRSPFSHHVALDGTDWLNLCSLLDVSDEAVDQGSVDGNVRRLILVTFSMKYLQGVLTLYHRGSHAISVFELRDLLPTLLAQKFLFRILRFALVHQLLQQVAALLIRTSKLMLHAYDLVHDGGGSFRLTCILFVH